MYASPRLLKHSTNRPFATPYYHLLQSLLVLSQKNHWAWSEGSLAWFLVCASLLCGAHGYNQKDLNDALWETISQRLSSLISANPWHWSGYLQGTCIPLSFARIPTGYLHTPVTGQDTLARISTGYLHTPVTGQDPTGYLHTPVTGQDTYRVPAYPCHWQG